MTSHPTSRLAAVTVITMVGLASMLDLRLVAADGIGDEDVATLIERVVAQTTRGDVAARATRELRAGTPSGQHAGWMAVETVMSASGAFTWKVLNEGGSERTRNKIFRELLDAEAQACHDGSRDAAALTPANYVFTALARTGSGQARFRLTPRRQDTRLVDGTLTVDAEGHPLLLEGALAKSPSFWVRRVTVVKRFSRIAGVSLATSVESEADVKLVGRATFSMHYRYSEVNGRSVSHAALVTVPAADHGLGPQSPGSN